MKTILLLSLTLLAVSLHATTLECRDIHTTLTTSNKAGKYDTEGSVGNKNTIIKIMEDNTGLYLIGNEKVKLVHLSDGIGNMYFYERTIGGNINLYSLYTDGTLTISKAYDAFGMTKMNVQTIFQCLKKE